MREKIWLNDDWQFTETCTDDFLRGEHESVVKTVRLPHTVRETPYDYFDESIYQMVCGYRREIDAPENWRGRRVRVTFGAAGHSAEVWLNGEKLCEHRCGYTAFSADLSEHLRYGEKNILSLRVDSREQQNIPPFGYVIDYMTYGGLYREAWLEISEREALEDLFISARVSPGEAAAVTSFPDDVCSLRRRLREQTVRGLLTAEFRLAEDPADLSGLGVRISICPGIVSEAHSKPLAEKMMLLEALTAGTESAEDQTDTEAGGRQDTHTQFRMRLRLPAVHLWDVESPFLYTVRVELVRLSDGEILDRQEAETGFRHAVFRKDGFRLNGRKLLLCGLNRHQSWPYAGYAMPASMQRLDADILKNELGLNAVRTSHYPQSQHFIRRCDEIGLLVFTEIPGWQHIGDDEWKRQAVRNTEDMVLQYRSHPSIILWGVRINESQDDDEFYTATNAAAHRLDPTRQTGGVRYLKKSRLLEDVYTYNDFVHSGRNRGCEKKSSVTSEPDAPYLITEYNGHMYPTKMFDSAAHRQEHMLRHARVLDAVAGEKDIAGSFGWCMADYNTHREFGSGDRICYHGVLDMYRNPKPAAAVYAARQTDIPVLEVSSTMDIGEQPASRPGEVYVISNAEEVRVYRNDCYICTLQTERSAASGKAAFPHLQHPPVLLDDFIGTRIREEEGWGGEQAQAVSRILNHAAIYGYDHLPPRILAEAAKLMAKYRMSPDDAYQLYGKYIGSWGDDAVVYRFEAIKDGQVVKTVIKRPVESVHLQADADHTLLTDRETYDVAAVRLRMCDQDGNLLPFYNGSVETQTEGPVELIGPAVVTLRGGCGGTYVRTCGSAGAAALVLRTEYGEELRLAFAVEA